MVRKILRLSFVFSLFACSAEPVATGTKRDIANTITPSPSASPAPNPSTAANSTAGDATKGATLLKDNCDSCHKVGGGGSARDLTKTYADATMLEKALNIGAHNATLKKSITDNKADYQAALAKR